MSANDPTTSTCCECCKEIPLEAALTAEVPSTYCTAGRTPR